MLKETISQLGNVILCAATLSHQKKSPNWDESKTLMQ